MTSFAPTLPVVFVVVVVVIFVGRRSERHFTHNRCEQKRRDFCRSPFLPVRKSRKRKTTFTSGSRRRRRDAQHKEKGAALPSRRRRALLLLLLLLLLFSNGARARASKFVSISISFHKKKNLSSTRDDVSSLLIDQKKKEERYRTSPRFRFERQQRQHVFRRAPDRQANRRSVFPQRGNPPPREGRGRRRL